MQYCRKCKVSVVGNKACCPLCQGELTGEPSEEVYPEIARPKISSEFLLKLISFVAITAIVVCFAVNYMIPTEVRWSLISAAGILCAWLTTSVGIVYRKRVLKNITWQLFLITALSVLWDRFTGWRGWSLDFVLPCGCVASMISIFIIAKVLKMKAGEYVLYMIIGGIYGMLPFICLLFGMIHIVYPSVICTGISVIFIAALFIFRGKTTRDEMEKRFHL